MPWLGRSGFRPARRLDAPRPKPIEKKELSLRLEKLKNQRPYWVEDPADRKQFLMRPTPLQPQRVLSPLSTVPTDNIMSPPAPLSTPELSPQTPTPTVLVPEGRLDDQYLHGSDHLSASEGERLGERPPGGPVGEVEDYWPVMPHRHEPNKPWWRRRRLW